MAWTWNYQTAGGSPVDVEITGSSTQFPTQSEAETWIGETWRELLDAGADQVVLLDDERVVYTMGLNAE